MAPAGCLRRCTDPIKASTETKQCLRGSVILVLRVFTDLVIREETMHNILQHLPVQRQT